MTIRVCQVLHGIVGGGSEQVVLNYCSRMPDIHFDLLYQYEPNSQILERFQEANINCIQIPDKVHHPLKHLWAMFKIFRHGRYDIVHSHLDWYMNSYVCFLAMLAGIKKRIAHHHQAYSTEVSFRAAPRNFLCAVMRIPCKLFATHWLACGEAAAINGWGKSAVKKGKVTILPNAIDPERFKFNEKQRNEVRARYGISDDDFVVGHVGRFFPEKNHKFIIALFEKFCREHPNSRLLLVGNGPLRQDIQESVKKLGFDKNVIFARLQKDVVPFYCAMDVLLLPSTREAFPMTLVEAQYNGLSCIVSDAVPRETAITDNVYPLTINDVEPWCEKIGLMKLAVNREQPLIKNDRFDVNRCYKMLELFYQVP
ncbi:Glycosyltransferase involved in cell wall bisynthesis [Fibrobacter intestinalis]|uniref:Glycosyltransferase involved in cell wall bisynthesis n=2 Tax=Fibrobacteraceae TaxID=204431 RepID=A0A1T4K2L3_9BACT|nr:glycosyltransferase involved in cell wall bisynthesis [Fibrobacter sp. NR9]SJZ36684.1 Glycosyltransferase involved in cell wall bisynthesis [Fibrobacter intestinalis]